MKNKIYKNLYKDKKKNRKRTSNTLVQTIDIAPTMLAMAGIPVPNGYQGKDLSALLRQEKSAVRSYLFTENLWSTSFGNPRCESVQDMDWKYIRYYKNENPSALQQMKTANVLGISIINMLYGVHDNQIAQYRSFVENPIQGEVAVYEELFNLKKDPQETTNLTSEAAHLAVLEKMRSVWKKEIVHVRGDEPPKVLRYTVDSEAERIAVIEPK